MWTKSACVVLAWSILVMLVAVGMKESVRPAQANMRTASSTTEVTLASTLGVAASHVTSARPAARYVVQPGDTLSGIAARFAVRGGWPALYAANRPLIGPNPNIIHPGTVLVLTGQQAPVRYTVAPGDTLAGVAAALSVRGGWPALYAANRRVIGPDPNAIRPGTVLTVPRPAAPSLPASSPGRRPYPAPPSAPTGSRHRPLPVRTVAPVAAGMPQWLKTVLLAVGLLIGVVLLAELALVVRRRHLPAATPAVTPTAPPVAAVNRSGSGNSIDSSGEGPGPGQPDAAKAHIVVADYDRLIVTRSTRDGMVCVLRPPGEDPKVILRAARLVLPEDPYHQLADQLGLPASWPIFVADYDRLVVTRSTRDGTVCVLRPPGEDPKAILRAARLVLPEDPYEELADQLGVPAELPMG
jgi:LysM repeat protein